jgi:hypothetical protein
MARHRIAIGPLHDDFIRALRRGATAMKATVALITVVSALATATGNLPECCSMDVDDDDCEPASQG